MTAVVSIIAIFTFPLWKEYTLGISDKQGENYKEFDMKSRESYWEDRYIEFKSSPIIGIGFANISNPSEFSKKQV